MRPIKRNAAFAIRGLSPWASKKRRLACAQHPSHATAGCERAYAAYAS